MLRYKPRYLKRAYFYFCFLLISHAYFLLFLLLKTMQAYHYLLILLSFLLCLKGTNATALTYNVQANEEACFYVWADKPGKKLGFYFAVKTTLYLPFFFLSNHVY